MNLVNLKDAYQVQAQCKALGTKTQIKYHPCLKEFWTPCSKNILCRTCPRIHFEKVGQKTHHHETSE